MLRRLLLLALAVGLGWLIRRMMSGAARAARRQPAAARGSGAAPTRMVRDRVCNTFVPAASALTTTVGGIEHHFCSEGCRRRFLESAGAAPTPAR